MESLNRLDKIVVSEGQIKNVISAGATTGAAATSSAPATAFSGSALSKTEAKGEGKEIEAGADNSHSYSNSNSNSKGRRGKNNTTSDEWRRRGSKDWSAAPNMEQLGATAAADGSSNMEQHQQLIGGRGISSREGSRLLYISRDAFRVAEELFHICCSFIEVCLSLGQAS
jgi:hypothetical protein